MKKLMIAAAIVCAAAMVHAAAGTWDAGWTYWTGVGGELADDSGSDDFVGTAYLFAGLTKDQYDALTTSQAIWNAFDAAAETLTIDGATINVTDSGALDMGGYVFNNETDYPEGNVYAAVIVTHDDGTGTIDAYSANTMYGEATALSLQGVDQVALGWGEGATGTPTTWQAAATPTPTPEPTSGLLLLLGVAGLALRRRRA